MLAELELVGIGRVVAMRTVYPNNSGYFQTCCWPKRSVYVNLLGEVSKKVVYFIALCPCYSFEKIFILKRFHWVDCGVFHVRTVWMFPRSVVELESLVPFHIWRSVCYFIFY